MMTRDIDEGRETWCPFCKSGGNTDSEKPCCWCVFAGCPTRYEFQKPQSLKGD